jgi:phosphatidylglycerophosphatase C
MGGDSRSAIDAWADTFVQSLNPKHVFRQAALTILEAHRRSGDRLVLLSASPDLYVPRIGQLLGFDLTICTEVEWRGEHLDGALKTPNRRGAEKLRCLQWLRSQCPGYSIYAYGNSASDLVHLGSVEWPMLVNGNFLARRQGARLRVPVGGWL